MSSSKEEIARREGMSYAFRYAKEHGLDELEKELKNQFEAIGNIHENPELVENIEE